MLRIAPLIYERDGYACVYCCREADDVQLSIDHVTPVSWFARGTAVGDADAPENLVTACLSCNSSKRDMDLALYAMYLRRALGRDLEEVAALKRRVHSALRCRLPQ